MPVACQWHAEMPGDVILPMKVTPLRLPKQKYTDFSPEEGNVQQHSSHGWTTLQSYIANIGFTTHTRFDRENGHHKCDVE
uniref:Uncharacterized protein n=1 Tax=Moniliophthora roreri TaxID=221103 RepID=A0A0W0FA70_MONRR